MTTPAGALPVPIRPLDPGCPAEVELVAARMRLTLIEVLGEERGGSMYDLEWLRERVRWHLDPGQCTGEVFLALGPGGAVSGHTIVRVEREGADAIGLFSTTFVAPEARRRGVATALLDRGEGWFRERGLPEAVTYTDRLNARLIRLFEGRGYRRREVANDMVRLARPLAEGRPR